MKKIISLGLLLLCSHMNMSAMEEAEKLEFTFASIGPEGSLQDCKQISYPFIEQVYKDTGINAHERVDKNYEWLESLRREGNKELNIICASDKKNSLPLASCLAFMAKAEKKIAVIRMMAVNSKYSQTDVFCRLVGQIRKFSLHEMEAVVTSLPKITILHDLMIKSGFHEIDFNPEGCPKETWQGYKKELIN